ncbi:MAG: hypothetical protein ACD_60C00121G0013 [uncultured bacterium]|nr:MAG: hypothetical protein ACD_60C00121G0013 [uncultured bacterium]
MLSWSASLKNTLLLISGLLLSGILYANEGIQVYQQNSHFSSERKRLIADDIDRYNNADNIWDILRQEFALPHYEDNPLVQERIAWFLNHQSYLMSAMNRAAPYLYYIFQQAKKRNLPAELVLLPIIESAYNPFARNASSGAAGIWQMMRDTASGYGIRQNRWYDGRRDVVASTKAALNHLAYLQSFFQGNWLLAIAAYDTGEGNVLSAISKNIKNGESIDYWDLPLAEETRDYVPRLLALAVIISHPDKYFIQFPSVPNAPYLAEVDIGAHVDLKHAAYLAGISLKKLKQLNPGYSRSATGPHGPFKLVLPIENVEQFSENTIRPPHVAPPISRTILASEQEELTNTKNTEAISNDRKMISTALQNTFEKYTLQPGDTLYMVRKRDDLTKIAKRFHITPSILASVNRIRPDSALYIGQKLIIPTHHKNPAPELIPGDTVYMVRKGDTIDKIARRFHTTAEAVRVVNLLAGNDLQEGDRLVIPTV